MNVKFKEFKLIILLIFINSINYSHLHQEIYLYASIYIKEYLLIYTHKKKGCR